jgi:hypothetical protein
MSGSLSMNLAQAIRCPQGSTLIMPPRTFF